MAEACITPKQFLREYLRWNESSVKQWPKNLLLNLSPLPIHIRGSSLKLLSAQIDLQEDLAIVSGTGMGAPAVAFYVELFRSLGTEHLATVGFAGSLVSELDPGHVVCCKRAIIDEGLSGHYKPPHINDKEASVWSNSTGKGIELLGLKEVTAWTTDAFFRETQEKLSWARSLGAQVVDMEASAIFSMSQSLGFSAISIFVVSDQIIENNWRPSKVALKSSLQLAFNKAHEWLGIAYS